MRQYKFKSFVLLMLLVGFILLAASTVFIGLVSYESEEENDGIISVYGLPAYKIPNIRFVDESGLTSSDYMLLKLSMLSDINASYGCDIFIWGNKAYSSAEWDRQFSEWAGVTNRDLVRDIKDWEQRIKEVPGFRVSERVGKISSKFAKEHKIGSGNILEFPELRNIVDTCATVYNKGELSQEVFDSLYAVTLSQLRDEHSKESLIATLKSRSDSGIQLRENLERVATTKDASIEWIPSNGIAGRAFEYAVSDLVDLTGMTVDECRDIGYGAALLNVFDEVPACGDLVELQRYLEMGADVKECFVRLLKFWDSAGTTIYAYEDERRLALQT